MAAPGRDADRERGAAPVELPAVLSNDAIQRALACVEQEVPVESWTIDGVRVWPLIKADIASESFRAGRTVVGQKRPERLAERYPLRPALEMLRTSGRRLRAKLRDGARDQRVGPADALLYSDGASFVKLDGGYYERFCDPIRERLATRGKTAMMVTPLAEFHHPRYAPSLFVQGRLNAARLGARVRSAVITRHASHLPDFERAARMMGESAPAMRVFGRERYERLVTYLLAYQGVYEELLSAVAPSVVFIVCYYAIEPMALIRACRARGAVSVDLQHGTVNDSHFAYAGRHRFPSDGFDLLPDACWVWSADEERTILGWTREHPAAPRAIVGGNPFLEAWRDDDTPLVRDASERVATIERRAGGLAHVMYTAQGYETDAELERLADAIGRSRDRYFWWIRLHPANPGAQPAVEAALARAGTTNHVVQRHTDIPLYGVLRRMDAHVTHSSSTVIEAAAFGVPSVLTSRSESVMYRAQIEAGWAVVCDEGEDLVAAVTSQLDAAPRLRAGDASTAGLGEGRVERALDAIFAMSADRRRLA